MKKLVPRRGLVMVLAILLVAGGVAWTTYQEHQRETEGLGGEDGFPTTGYISSVRHDSIGCESSIPFAAKNCRFVARINHRVVGASVDQTSIVIEKYRFLPPPSVAGGDPVTGICAPNGRCHFDQLKDRPWGLVISLLSLFGAMLVGGWIYRQRRRAP